MCAKPGSALQFLNAKLSCYQNVPNLSREPEQLGWALLKHTLRINAYRRHGRALLSYKHYFNRRPWPVIS